MMREMLVTRPEQASTRRGGRPDDQEMQSAADHHRRMLGCFIKACDMIVLDPK
jgi:hypothetical protein